ncbi:MAG: glutamine synthetase beta-grasp domain-containing protein [Rhodobacteraceae bacterium]|nr:glutamine synthetase beta-grasp domain-containing protein [Paracoccaceae bacterium]
MIKLEYVWLDGCAPQQLRSKTKVVSEFSPQHTPVWGFDGSSTEQADGYSSDCVLKPCRTYPNPLDSGDSYIVLCEVWDVGDTPHPTNHRARAVSRAAEVSDLEPWVGFEQEHTLFTNERPLGWPQDGTEPAPQGDYYCGRNEGESLVREHLDACITAGIGIAGINSEVMLGQWEYQIFGADPILAADDLWIARWLLEKLAAKKGVLVSLHPKPIKGDWNGAGLHTNFSTKEMRNTDTGYSAIQEAIYKLSLKQVEHMAVYGKYNKYRLTGNHETCDMNIFKSGVSDRGASIRIPWKVEKEQCGYIEDRRPASNADPYSVIHILLTTICHG